MRCNSCRAECENALICEKCGCLNYFGTLEPPPPTPHADVEYVSTPFATHDWARAATPRTFSRTVAFDTETALIAPNLGAPPMACLTWQMGDQAPQIIGATDECHDMLVDWLTTDTLIIGHHTPYDMGVICAQWPDLLPLVFAAYSDLRVTDTKIREQLLDISVGQYRMSYQVSDEAKKRPRNYGLADITQRRLGVHMPKDGWRLRYGEFVALPIDQWLTRASELRGDAIKECADAMQLPDGKAKTDKLKTMSDLFAIANGEVGEVMQYPLRDAAMTMSVFRHQGAEIINEFEQSQYAWWLHLMSCAGLQTDEMGVELFRQGLRAQYDAAEADLKAEKLVKKDGVRDTKAAQERMQSACDAIGIVPNKTEKGAIQLDEEACRISGDETLALYASFSGLKKGLSADCAMLEGAGHYVAHTRFGLAETGRTTSSKPNIQNLSSYPGVRDCFIPRPGFVFAQADYGGLELCTLAQVCLRLFGYSRLAAIINAGQDVHLAMGAKILKIDYEKALGNKGSPEVKMARKLAKIANFGFPGGLGISGVQNYALRAPYNVTLTDADAKSLRADWGETWPETTEYFRYIRGLPANINPNAKPREGFTPSPGLMLRQVFSGRIRGNCMYTQAANSLFQGLGSDATKHAGFLLSRACYTDRKSVLYGSVPVAFIHDEFLVEVPAARGHACAQEMARIIVAGANEFLPDVPVKTEPLLMRQWSKKAEPVYLDGKLVPWVES